MVVSKVNPDVNKGFNMKDIHQYQRHTQCRLICKNLMVSLIIGWMFLSFVPNVLAISLKFGVYAPLNNLWIEGIKEFKQQIEIASQETIRIEIVSANNTLNPMKMLHEVQNGNIDIVLSDSISMGNIVRAIKIFELPFLFRDKAQSLPFIHGSVAKALLKETGRHGFVGIGFVSSEPNMLINSVRPIKSIDDLKGLKIATFASPTQVGVIKAMGGVPVPMSWMDTTSAFVTGVVDSAEGTPSLFYSAETYKGQNFITYFPTYYNPGVIVANPKMWKRLSNDERRLFESHINRMTTSIEKKIEFNTLSTLNIMKEFGASIEYPTDIKSFREAVKPVFKSVSKELPDYFRTVAYNTAYTKRELKVCSRPEKATVYYRRYGDKRYQLFHKPTDTDLFLEFAAWYIRVEKDKYIPEEKLFDPYVSTEWRVSFDLKPN